MPAAKASVPTIRLTVADRIATITLSRPHARNAVNERMAQELRDACERIRQDDAIRVAILTGAGAAFCIGADIDSNALTTDDLVRLKAAHAIAAIEKPTIALINGDALDQGLELALACDIRIGASHAKFGLTQVSGGAIPWDGGAQRLPRLIGQSRALQLILTARIIDAAEALNIGLLNHAADPADTAAYAANLAAAIAAHAPIAARYLKETLLKGADMTLAQGLALEADLSVILQSTADRAEGIASFLHRRPPRYRGE